MNLIWKDQTGVPMTLSQKWKELYNEDFNPALAVRTEEGDAVMYQFKDGRLVIRNENGDAIYKNEPAPAPAVQEPIQVPGLVEARTMAGLHSPAPDAQAMLPQATCELCGERIENVGTFWRHMDSNPRHPGKPILDPKLWAEESIKMVQVTFDDYKEACRLIWERDQNGGWKDRDAFVKIARKRYLSVTSDVQSGTIDALVEAFESHVKSWAVHRIAQASKGLVIS